MDVIGRVESGTETETTSGTSYLQDVGKGRKQERKLCRATLTLNVDTILPFLLLVLSIHLMP